MRWTTEAEIIRHPDLQALKGYLWKKEGARLAWLAERVPAGQCILEIGSYVGKSASFLATGSAAGHGVPVHCVDLWDLGGQGEYVELGFDLPETYELFRAQTEPHRDMIVEHKAHSVEFAAEWDGPPIGLLFIDGDHRYEACLADLQAWLPHMAPGGWVTFHDYTANLPGKPNVFPGVVRCVDEWVAWAGKRKKITDVTRSRRLVAVKLQ